MPKKPDNEFKCEKCGKLQSRNEEQSSEYFGVFDYNQKCECGGKFDMYIDGHKIG